MTTLTLRYIKGDFVVTGPEIEPIRFKSRREAKDWCRTHYPGSPIKEIGPIYHPRAERRAVKRRPAGALHQFAPRALRVTRDTGRATLGGADFAIWRVAMLNHNRRPHNTDAPDVVADIRGHVCTAGLKGFRQPHSIVEVRDLQSGDVTSACSNCVRKFINYRHPIGINQLGYGGFPGSRF